MRILLFGKYGQLGWELQRALSLMGELIVLAREDVDLQNKDELRRTIQSLKPSLIINAAAYTDVDRAEHDPKAAFQVNEQAIEVMSTQAAALDAGLIHFSTDYVFDGNKAEPYNERDEPNPLSVYGTSKLAGERVLQGSKCRYLILRCSWIYSNRCRNFPTTILRVAMQQDQLQVVDDCFGAPTSVQTIADITARIVDQNFVKPHGEWVNGIYHLSCDSACSWHEFATFLVERAHKAGLPLRLSPHQIDTISEKDYRTAAQRPMNSRFSTTKIEQDFCVQMPHWQEGVERLISESAFVLSHYGEIYADRVRP